ncbi:M23 family metallopeptidase [Aridibaculum aurantiacum]|uniref:M23 family metallopeptidase n=1 Tax=Aridibaculum aurantiacum TaxID=2810307 RepID=UPI001A95882B|nr:M23 family metallopeptidase [Aridibaculum aurantiacum]
MSYRIFPAVIALIVISFSSCTTSGPSGIFGKKSPHEAYGDKLKSAGLHETALGKQWFQAAERSLVNPVQVKLPYRETGYFSADQPRAAGVRFAAKRGEKININLSKKPTTGFMIYVDLWQPGSASNTSPKLLSSADTTDATLEYEVKQEGTYLVRLQPELLKGGEYTLSITTAPSLAFPVSPDAKSNIGSFWGANRDGGARRHEGIDIFAARRTPLVAAADGVIGAVNENNLGGKVVWLRPLNRDYTLYYAHLDEQLVQPGQRVKAGDVIGLMGNTGNAKTTSPHLHFGIYAAGGAVDPLPFVNKNTKEAPRVTAPLQHLAKKVKTTRSTSLTANADGSGKTISLDANTVLVVEAAAENKFRATLPDGTSGYIASSMVADIDKPIRKTTISKAHPLLDAPSAEAPQKAIVSAGEAVNVLASFNNFYYVSTKDVAGWMPKQVL